MNKYTSIRKLNTEGGRGLKCVCLFLLLWIILKYNLLSTCALFCDFFFLFIYFVSWHHYTTKTLSSVFLSDYIPKSYPKLWKLIFNIHGIVITQTKIINTYWSSDCLVEIKQWRSVSIESVGGNIGFDFVYGCWAKSQNWKLGSRPQTQTPTLCVPLRHLMD